MNRSTRLAASLVALTLFGAGCGSTSIRTPDEARQAEARADELYLSEHYAAAERAHRELATSHPSPARRDHHALRVAQCQAAVGNEASAVRGLENLLGREDPPVDRIVSARADAVVGEIHRRADRDEEAVRHLSRALERGRSDVKRDAVQLSLAISLQRLGRWNDADQHLDDLVTEYPISPLREEAERRQRHRHFSIQVAAFQSSTSALAEAERLTRGGLPAFLERSTGERGTLFCVRVGRYETWSEADSARGDMSRRGRIQSDAFLVP